MVHRMLVAMAAVAAWATEVPMEMEHVLVDLVNITLTRENCNGTQPPSNLMPLFAYNATLYMKPPAVDDLRLFSVQLAQDGNASDWAPEDTFQFENCSIVSYLQVNENRTFVLCTDKLMQVWPDGLVQLADGIDAGIYYRPGFLALLDEGGAAEVALVTNEHIARFMLAEGKLNLNGTEENDAYSMVDLSIFNTGLFSAHSAKGQDFLLHVLPGLGMKVVTQVREDMMTRETIIMYPTQACKVAGVSTYRQYTMTDSDISFGTPVPESVDPMAQQNYTSAPRVLVEGSSIHIEEACASVGRTQELCNDMAKDSDCEWADQTCRARPCIGTVELTDPREEGVVPDLASRFLTPSDPHGARDVHVVPDAFAPHRQTIMHGGKGDGYKFIQSRQDILGPGGALYVVAYDYTLWRMNPSSGGSATLLFDPQLPSLTVENEWAICDIEHAAERMLIRYYYRMSGSRHHFVVFSDGTPRGTERLEAVDEGFPLPGEYGFYPEGLTPLAVVAVHGRLFFTLHIQDLQLPQKKELWGINVSGRHCKRHATYCVTGDFLPEGSIITEDWATNCYRNMAKPIVLRDGIITIQPAEPQRGSAVTVWKLPQRAKVRHRFPSSFDNVWFVVQCVLMTTFYCALGAVWFTTVSNKKKSLAWLEAAKKNGAKKKSESGSRDQKKPAGKADAKPSVSSPSAPPQSPGMTSKASNVPSFGGSIRDKGASMTGSENKSVATFHNTNASGPPLAEPLLATPTGSPQVNPLAANNL